MLEKLHLENFKCFQRQTVEFKPLTLLTGVNSAGKSSVIQSLLMMQQTFAEHWPHPEAQLAGKLVNLGLPEDVLYSEAEEDHFSVSFERDKETYTLRGMVQERKVKTQCPQKKKGEFTNFYYLNAERICPRTLFPIPTEVQRSYNAIGNQGEYAAYLLHEKENESIPYSDAEQPNLLAPGKVGSSPSLLQQTEAWLSTLGAPLRLRTERPTGTDAVVLRFSFPDISRSYYRPTNVGFGLTYVLPVFVAILSAQPGSFVILENPEAHLHPKGQAIMGRFLARAAGCGIQVVVETHSDHVLNGIRLAVKQKDIAHDSVQINFFSHQERGVCIENPSIDPNGHIDLWPDDFFDEWDKQLTELL